MGQTHHQETGKQLGARQAEGGPGEVICLMAKRQSEVLVGTVWAAVDEVMGLHSTRELDEQVLVLAGLIHQVLEDTVVSIKQEVWENNVKLGFATPGGSSAPIDDHML